jgi:hypothetical protein
MGGALVWLAVLVALAALFALTLRRMSTLVRRTRDLERFQRHVAGLDQGLAAVVNPCVTHLDEIRRRSGDPASLAASLPETQQALRTFAAEGRSLRPPEALARHGVAIVVELERAVRATDLVEHGLGALLADRSGRELEAQTSLKRGALNLRHAREAMARLAAEVAAVRPGDLITRRDDPAVARAMMPARHDDDVELERV